MKELIVSAKIENLTKVQDFVRTELEDCLPKVQKQIAIAVDEIFSNITLYAYNQGTGDAAVRIASGDDVVIEFEDGGAPYDPLTQDDPDISLDLDEREFGGLGIFMVKNLMDSVEYKREGSKNILTIRKKF